MSDSKNMGRSYFKTRKHKKSHFQRFGEMLNTVQEHMGKKRICGVGVKWKSRD